MEAIRNSEFEIRNLDPFGDSVTNTDCRFHHVANAYVAGVCFVRRTTPVSFCASLLRTAKAYINPAWVAVHFGFEVQIDELGQLDGAAIHKAGATDSIAEGYRQRAHKVLAKFISGADNVRR